MPGSFSPEQICSKALGLLGQDAITDITSTTNKNAKLCAQVYYITRDALLTSYRWGFATQRVMLAVSTTAPAFGYANQFPLPADFLRIQSTHDRLITYVIESGYLLTDSDEVGIIYTRRFEETGLMDPLFVEALAARIARELAMPILKKASAVQLADSLYREALSAAKLVEAMQDNPEDITVEEKSAWLAAR